MNSKEEGEGQIKVAVFKTFLSFFFYDVIILDHSNACITSAERCSHNQSFLVFFASYLLIILFVSQYLFMYLFFFTNISDIYNTSISEKFQLLKHLNIWICAVKENQSGLSFFAKASLSIFAARSVVSVNHKKRPTGWEESGRRIVGGK